jgi:hypothetical protein
MSEARIYDQGEQERIWNSIVGLHASVEGVRDSVMLLRDDNRTTIAAMVDANTALVKDLHITNTALAAEIGKSSLGLATAMHVANAALAAEIKNANLATHNINADLKQFNADLGKEIRSLVGAIHKLIDRLPPP